MARHTLTVALAGAAVLLLRGPCLAQQIGNDRLSLAVQAQDGTYSVQARGGTSQPILTARTGALVDYQWIRSSDYSQRNVTEAVFTDALGTGRQLTVSCAGLAGKPDLEVILQVYDQLPYGAVQVIVHNHTGKTVTVQAIRSAEASGQSVINLGGPESAGRVLSDSYSENWPTLVIYDLGQAPGQVHRAAGSQLIYNRESKQSLFFAALTADRLLTVYHLSTQGSGDGAKATSFTVDATGTTEFQKDNALRRAPAEQQIDISLPVNPGESISSERLMIAAGPDYLGQLMAYGDAIRRLHQARVSGQNLIGWWSWTSYYTFINEGAMETNARWMAAHLKALGYDYFHIDEGYYYARGEYTTTNATEWPGGVRHFGDEIRRLGLRFGIWTAPFEVSNRSWIYQHHKDWLVHTASGDPIAIGTADEGTELDTLYALDTTHPGAQDYMRETYRVLTREWGVRFIKLDFMDTASIEGYRYRTHTTALEATRIGLEVIRNTVGDGVMLDKDGSPMLTPVGLVDTGRTSVDTGHAFRSTKASAPGIAARFYMHRNWFISDPDAFNVCEGIPVVRRVRTGAPPRSGGPAATPVTLQEAQAAIVLSTISGGMYEIGDDLPMLSMQKDRLALVENRELLQLAKLSRAFTPVDLLSYEAGDGQPSIFFLQGDQRQSWVAVFNFTETPRSHTLQLTGLGLPAGRNFQAFDVLNQGAEVRLESGALRLDNQPPHSVRMLRLVDATVAAAPPTVTAQVPSQARIGRVVKFSAEATGVPALAYHWDFGDGTTGEGAQAAHTYTVPADHTVRLTVDGLDGVPAQRSFPIKLAGPFPQSDSAENQRFIER